MNLKFLTQKKWGLPVWAWAIIASVIIFGVYYFYKKRAASSSSTPATTDTTGDTSGDIPISPYFPGGSGDSGGGGSFFSPPATDTNPPPAVEIITANPGPTPTTSTTPPSSPSASLTAHATISSPGVVNTVPGGGEAFTTLPGQTASSINNAIEGSGPPIKTTSTKTIPGPTPGTTPQQKAVQQGSGKVAVGSGKNLHALGGGL